MTCMPLGDCWNPWPVAPRPCTCNRCPACGGQKPVTTFPEWPRYPYPYQVTNVMYGSMTSPPDRGICT